MNGIIEHAKKEAFVFATALSALVHSTWVLSVMFSGHAPEWQLNIVAIARFLYWLIPGLLIAVALDVGQVSTAISIKRKPTMAKAITFVVFAVATYYLQWLYMLHHMPVLDYSDGVSANQLAVIVPLKDMALWFIPLLLPLSTVLYTLSSDNDHQVNPVSVATVATLVVEQPTSAILPVRQIEHHEPPRHEEDTQPAPAPVLDAVAVGNRGVQKMVQCVECGESFRTRSNKTMCKDCTTRTNTRKRVAKHRVTQHVQPEDQVMPMSMFQEGE